MPCYKICQSVVQVKKFAPHLHHTIKSFAIIRNFIDKYNILIIFAICLQIVKYQRIYKRLKSATFKYCPGHTEIKSQLIINRLRFFISILHHICTTHNINIRFHTPRQPTQNSVRRSRSTLLSAILSRRYRCASKRPAGPATANPAARIDGWGKVVV